MKTAGLQDTSFSYLLQSKWPGIDYSQFLDKCNLSQKTIVSSQLGAEAKLNVFHFPVKHPSPRINIFNYHVTPLL